MWYSFYPTSAYLYLSMMSCRRDYVTNQALVPLRSVWNFVSMCVCAQEILPESYQLSCQRALIVNPGSYFYRLTAKLLQNFCFGFGSVGISSCLCWLVVTSLVTGYSSTFEYLLQQGVNFHRSLCAQVPVRAAPGCLLSCPYCKEL